MDSDTVVLEKCSRFTVFVADSAGECFSRT